ncbi:hypothetical protein NL676_024888 [Syzygium grande]|nr:hypothetical protein NL676_024888 [Syzygium grande]
MVSRATAANKERGHYKVNASVAFASGEGKFVDTVRSAQLGITLPNVKCVDAKGLDLKTDHLHLITTGQNHLASLLTDAFLASHSRAAFVGANSSNPSEIHRCRTGVAPPRGHPAPHSPTTGASSFMALLELLPTRALELLPLPEAPNSLGVAVSGDPVRPYLHCLGGGRRQWQGRGLGLKRVDGEEEEEEEQGR